VGLVSFSNSLGHPGLLVWFVSIAVGCFLQEIACKALQFVGVVVPKWLALGEVSDKSDFVTSRFLVKLSTDDLPIVWRSYLPSTLPCSGVRSQLCKRESLY
jgi:hypothetical protein